MCHGMDQSLGLCSYSFWDLLPYRVTTCYHHVALTLSLFQCSTLPQTLTSRAFERKAVRRR